jgi:hypothetical protein
MRFANVEAQTWDGRFFPLETTHEVPYPVTNPRPVRVEEPVGGVWLARALS